MTLYETPHEEGEPELPDLDFLTTPEVSYDPETIAENALWPIADLRWGGDFRTESEPNLPCLSVSRAGYYNGRWYEVTLDAEVEVDEYFEDEDESDTKKLVRLQVDTVTIHIEQLVPEQTQVMIDLAREQGCQPVEKLLESVGDLAAETQLRAIAGVKYIIDSDGDYSIRPYRALIDSTRYPLWRKGLYNGFDDEEEDEANDQLPEDVEDAGELTEPSFGEEDIKQLIIAATILKAPEESIAYLEYVLAHPEDQ